MDALVGWLDASGLARVVGGAAYAWINSAHLLGLIMLVGAIGVVDLRVAGLWRAVPLMPLSLALTPIAVAGLVLMAGTGSLLFAADARALIRSETFLTKLVLIGIALANAALFRLLRRRDAGETPGWPLRTIAVVSLVLWLAVALHGRMIAYR